jgi:hypothetical protein
MRIYLSHPYGGKEENRERAAAIAKFYREVWQAEGRDYEIVNPLEYLEPLSDGVPEYTLLKLAVNLLKSCDAVLFAPGWKKSRGCRLEHFAAKGKLIAEIPAEVGEIAEHYYTRHHIIVRRAA